MRNYFKQAWGSVRSLWTRITKKVTKLLDDFSMRRVKNMKGYKVVAVTASTRAPIRDAVAPAPSHDTVAIQMDELDDWNVIA